MKPTGSGEHELNLTHDTIPAPPPPEAIENEGEDIDLCSFPDDD